ncbi:hypothetical protein D910_11183 [Dendroctonus ponderosae]|uniref:Uncharacterized protein n=1 Tax=Dendroctonus ponderosae TaxID=77166 RepID=U4ULB7_DENPD|nr:hypothetical protein D910_11183 [Dendroctonus ponderosae]
MYYEDNKHTDQIDEFLAQIDEAKDDPSIFVNAGADKIGDNQKVIEIIVSDLLMTVQGKQSLKTLYHFVKHNSEWVFWKLGISEKTELTPGNKVLNPPDPLVHKMFHIGYRPFDQLLTRQLKPNWHHLLQTSLGLTLEKVWNQVSRRWDFQSSASSQLKAGDVDIVNNLSLILKQ